MLVDFDGNIKILLTQANNFDIIFASKLNNS